MFISQTLAASKPSVHSECIFGSFIAVLMFMIVEVQCERGRATCLSSSPGKNISVLVNL